MRERERKGKGEKFTGKRGGVVEITGRRQREKDKGRRKGYQREGEKKIK